MDRGAAGLTTSLTREHVEDRLAACGAYLEVDTLPEWIENRPRFKAFGEGLEMRDDFHRIRVVNWQCVPGPLLVWIDDHRDEIIRIWTSAA